MRDGRAAARVLGADVALLRDLARWAERELVHSIERARVQRVLTGLLPEPLVLPGGTVDGLVVPHERGGDLVDWRVASDGALHATVGSVAAAGRAAALLAASARAAVVARTDVAVDAAITGLEAQLTPDLSAAGAVGSLLHVRLDPTDGRVTWADAGHGLALLARADGSVTPIRSTDRPFGLQRTGHRRTTGSADLGHGDRVVLLTSGALALAGWRTSRASPTWWPRTRTTCSDTCAACCRGRCRTDLAVVQVSRT